MNEEVQVDLDALNPVITTAEPKQVQDVEVVFVPFEDIELSINRTVKRLRKDVPTKLSRDEARVLLDAKKGYTK